MFVFTEVCQDVAQSVLYVLGWFNLETYRYQQYSQWVQSPL
jgi:hypothetical protein